MPNSRFILHPLNATGRLDPVLSAIAAALLKAEARLAQLVDLPLTDVVLAIDPRACIPSLGHGGYCPGPHQITLSFDPDNPACSGNLDLPLQATIAHEVHHALRWAGPGYGQTLGEALVTESLAIAFEHEAFDMPQAPWEVMPADRVDLVVAEARAAWATTTYDHDQWFFGHGQASWSGHGYALATRLVSRWLAGEATRLASRQAGVPANVLRPVLDALT